MRARATEATVDGRWARQANRGTWNSMARGEGESSKARRGDNLEVTVLATDSSKGDNGW